MKRTLESMKKNLFWKLRGWYLKKVVNECVTLSQVCDKMAIYAPKSIKNNRDAFRSVALDIYSTEDGYSESELLDFEREDLESWLDDFFRTTEVLPECQMQSVSLVPLRHSRLSSIKKQPSHLCFVGQERRNFLRAKINLSQLEYSRLCKTGIGRFYLNSVDDLKNRIRCEYEQSLSCSRIINAR